MGSVLTTEQKSNNSNSNNNDVCWVSLSADPQNNNNINNVENEESVILLKYNQLKQQYEYIKQQYVLENNNNKTLQDIIDSKTYDENKINEEIKLKEKYQEINEELKIENSKLQDIIDSNLTDFKNKIQNDNNIYEKGRKELYNKKEKLEETIKIKENEYTNIIITNNKLKETLNIYENDNITIKNTNIELEKTLKFKINVFNEINLKYTDLEKVLKIKENELKELVLVKENELTEMKNKMENINIKYNDMNNKYNDIISVMYKVDNVIDKAIETNEYTESYYGNKYDDKSNEMSGDSDFSNITDDKNNSMEVQGDLNKQTKSNTFGNNTGIYELGTFSRKQESPFDYPTPWRSASSEVRETEQFDFDSDFDLEGPIGGGNHPALPRNQGCCASIQPPAPMGMWAGGESPLPTPQSPLSRPVSRGVTRVDGAHSIVVGEYIGVPESGTDFKNMGKCNDTPPHNSDNNIINKKIIKDPFDYSSDSNYDVDNNVSCIDVEPLLSYDQQTKKISDNASENIYIYPKYNKTSDVTPFKSDDYCSKIKSSQVESEELTELKEGLKKKQNESIVRGGVDKKETTLPPLNPTNPTLPLPSENYYSCSDQEWDFDDYYNEYKRRGEDKYQYKKKSK